MPKARAFPRSGQSPIPLVLLLLLCAWMGPGIAACGDGSEIDVRLNSGTSGQVAQAAEPGRAAALRFAYASVLSPARSTLVYARLADYLSTRLDRPVEIIRRRTYAEVNDLLRTGTAQAGLICTGAFAAGMDRFGLRAIAIPEVDGERTYRSYVIARRGVGIATFDDLEGRSFAFTDPLSNTGYRYVVDRLHRLGTSPQVFFRRTMFTYSHDNSIEAVLDGLVEAGSVDSLVWDEMVRRDAALLHALNVVERSPAFPINPVAVSGDADPALVLDLKRVLLAMHENPEGRGLLDEMGVDRMVVPEEETLEGYRAIAASWRGIWARAAGAGVNAR